MLLKSRLYVTNFMSPSISCWRRHFSLFKPPEKTNNILKKQLLDRINTFGPLTVAEYMKECLCNPVYGYYNTHSVFGKRGDFTTSPEICQIFGELIGVWLLQEWKRQNCPQHIQLVELGPGRGTLSADILRKHDGNWNEVLISSMANTNELCFIRSNTRTPASIAYLPLVPNLSDRNAVEICPDMMCLTQVLCKRISQTGGAALLIDYGHEGEKGDTFRGFHAHTVCDPLIDPGNIDLTCDVDFSLLCHTVKESGERVTLHGPVTQAYFLINMGLFTRLQILLSKCKSEKEQNELFSACEMLITNEQMGGRFKFVAITPEFKEMNNSRLPGFTPLPGTPYAQEKTV
ncbi:unnamed protein product [Trichobilharzia szidati]|nr:unnamed protein product [Trichobilharzia szidati]